MKLGKLARRALNGWRNFLGITMFCVVTIVASSAQTLTTLVNFDKSNGAYPVATLVQGVDGKLYGTTGSGGANGFGTVFATTPGGTLTTLHNFANSDGWGPTNLVLGSNGTFYGLANYGSGLFDGETFAINSKGKFTRLDTFISIAGTGNDSMILSTSGSLYGTTFAGGSSDYGSVFKMTAGGAFTTLYSFSCLTGPTCPGAAPSGLAQGTDGGFYGTNTSGNSTSNAGTIFRITPSGTLSTLYSFCAQGSPCIDGSWPDGLVQAADGDFYGTTVFGGISGSPCQPNGPGGCGTVFKVTPIGLLTTLYTFCKQEPPCTDGGLPLGPLIQGTDGNLYGTTTTSSGAACTSPGPCGTIFRITPSGALTTLHVFSYTDGSQPRALTQATDGNLYGVANSGGTYGWGTVFRLSTGMGPFVKFVQPAGKIGQTVGIIGQNFKGTTSVLFNRTPASFTVVSGYLIKAIVPAGATDGFVTVQTPSGPLKSNIVFAVL